MKFSIKELFRKYKIRRKLWIWSLLLKKYFMENFIFCAVSSLKCVTPNSHFNTEGALQRCFQEKVSSKYTASLNGEHPCQNVISIKLLCNFIEITYQHGCSPVHLLHIFRTPYTRNTSGWLLLMKFVKTTHLVWRKTFWWNVMMY